jgi:hypothetical protein
MIIDKCWAQIKQPKTLLAYAKSHVYIFIEVFLNLTMHVIKKSLSHVLEEIV